VPSSKLLNLASLPVLLCAAALAAQTTAAPAPMSSATTQTTAASSATTPTVLRGTVTDPDLAVVPGATITVTPAKGPALTTTSGADGTYKIPSVPPGTYSVTITMPGFASVVRQGQKFATGQVVNMDVKLAIQENSTEVSVTTSSNQVSVDADSNASSVTIKGKDLDALSDDPDELSSELSALAGPAAGPNGGQIYVDGFTGGQLPPKSSIREIRVNQNPFSAQYERPGYGRVEVLTKPGTDSFHGQANVQGLHSSFNTANPFLKGQDFPAYHTFFFLGSLTGPISKKASFSAAGSYRNIADNAIINATIPVDSTGAFCQPGNAACTFTALRTAVTQPRLRYDFTPRIDLALSDKNTLIVRYQFEHGDQQGSFNGGFNLASSASNVASNEGELQISDSHIFSPRLINETRFEYQRARASSQPLSTAATLLVSGFFTGGGTSTQTSATHTDHIEVQNYTSIQLAKNFIRMGGRLRTTREALNSNPGANGQFTYTTAADYLANRPRQYSVTQINQANLEQRLTDVGLYFEDDWKPKPNLTVSIGTRLEAQTDINSSRDFAPRVSIAYGIPRKGGSPTTVVRTGFGIFNNRFDLGNVINSTRQNGVNQVQFINSAPAVGCSPANLTACGGAAASRSTVYTLAPNLRSEYNVQYAFGVDQQLSKTASLSVNYIGSRGFHQFMSRVVGTTATAYNYQYQSEGVYKQHQIIANGNYRPSRNFSLFGYYAYSIANANTNGASFFPTDSTNSRTDYGRAGFNNAHRLFLFGNFTLPYQFSLSPFMNVNSGSPYSIATGTDVNGDSQFNDRPAYAPGLTSASCTSTAGYVTPAAGTTYTPIPINSCTGPANVSFNLRVGKSFGFGKRAGAVAAPDAGGGAPAPGARRGGGGGGGGGGRGGPGGGGPGGGGPFGGGGSNAHRYNFNLSAQAFDLFNYVPYAAPVGTLTSPNFGKSVAIAGGFGGNQSAVRRIALQLTFNF
jgi:hypothetical protein